MKKFSKAQGNALINRRGNALFLILIAVALFAALSYAITQSGRGGSGGVGKEQASIHAALIVQAASSMKTAVQRMILSGTPAASIVCEPAPNGSDCGRGSANGGKDLCTTGADCLFAPEGGGASVPSVPTAAYILPGGAYVNFFAGDTTYRGFVIDGFNGGGGDTAIPNMGTAAVDDVAYFAHLRLDVCTAINRGLGVTGIPDITGWVFTNVSGMDAACMQEGTDYHYFQILNAN